MKPGVVSVHFGDAMDKDVKHFFVSGGRLIVILSCNAFFARTRYFPRNH
jgi:hypothetical protein